MIEFLVDKNVPINDTTFNTLTDAINALPEKYESARILVSPGSYYEKIELRKGNLSIEGLGKAQSDTVVYYDDFARKDMPDGSKYGTFRSYSFFIDANNVSLKNLTISNTSGPENEAWQAIALYADGDNLLFENIRLLGHQDTLFTGPLPPKEVQPGGFIGPKQFDARINGTHLYKNCYICGNVDFIFGSATAVFEGCEIESIPRSGADKDVQGYVTAASTPEGQDEGYTFRNCRFVSADCPELSVYLGRPWREYAKVIFIGCEIGNHIKDEGFHDWNKPKAHETSYYAVRDSHRPDGSIYTPSADFVKP